MSHWVAIENPDVVIDWFADYREPQRSRKPVGPCPHACEHRVIAIVAWGPDLAHYELAVCNDGCGGDCRGWLPADRNGEGGLYGPSRKAAMADPETWRLLAPVDRETSDQSTTTQEGQQQ